MDEVEFHGEPPTNLPTMVVAFGGWVDAGEAATGAMRSLVRQLAATPLATIDPEEFVDFTTIRPVVRLSAAGERTIRWPRIALWTWQPPEGGAGLLLFRGVEPQWRWRTYATLLLDVAARCGVQRIVSLGAVLEAVPHTRPPQVTGTSTDPAWHAWLERAGWGGAGGTKARPAWPPSSRRRPGTAGWRISRCGGQCRITSGTPTNPAVRRALLTTLAPLLDLAAGCGALRGGRAGVSAPDVTRPSRTTPASRPMSGNWSRPMTRRATRRRAHGVTTPSTRSS